MRIITLAAAALFLVLPALAPLGAAKAIFFGCNSAGYANSNALDLSAAKKKMKKKKAKKEEYLRVAPTK